MRVIVYHRSYGCETGCCGHTVERFTDDVVNADGFDPRWDDSASNDGSRNFRFEHPYSADLLGFARRMVTEVYGAEHVADLDWDHCVVTDDC